TGAEPAGTAAGSGIPSVGWLFTGQGAQYRGMGRALCARSAVFRAAMAAVDEAMAPHLGRSVRALALGDDPDVGQALDQTQWAQPALFAVGWSLGSSLLALGVEPAWMVGHSIGES